MAAEFKATVEKAVANGDIAGGAAIAFDKSGRTLISAAFGNTSLDQDAKPFSLDSTMWIASCTKLSTAIAVLQCVAKGLLNLDEPIENVLPEWKEPQILTGFAEDGEPILEAAQQRITLRRMLTHSSGMSYSGLNPIIQRYRKTKGQVDTNSLIAQDYFYPLMFEPGQGWIYGVGIDHSGKAVEKVTGMSLGQYMAKNIWAPLGMKSTTFRPLENENIRSRMVGRVSRNPEGKLVKDESNIFPVTTREDDFGGGGLYSSTEDYVKIMASLLKNDGKLLEKEMYEELFRPQLENPTYLNDTVHHGIWSAALAPGYPRDESTKWDYALGGAYVARNIEGQAAEGTIFWSGLPNSYWFIDRELGICGFYGGWLLPLGDLPTGRMFNAFQRAAVKEATKTWKI